MPTKNIVSSSVSLIWRLRASGWFAGKTTTVLCRAMLSYCRLPGGHRGRQTHKAQIYLARLHRAKLFRRSHVEEVQRDVGEGLPEVPQRFGQQLEIQIRQIRDVQLAGFATAEALHRQDAFRRQGQNAPGIQQERAAFLG